MQDLTYNATGSNGSLDTNYDVQDEEENEALQTLVIYANRYLLPIIIVTGFLGNTISFFVFICSRLKRISTSVYLAALSISDTGFLFCVGFGWLDAMGIHFFHTHGICQIVVYMTFVFSFTSVWYVNAFTIEMYVAVFHPSKGAKVCKPRFARRAVLVLTAFAALLYMFAFWTAKVTTSGTDQKCMSTSSDRDTMMVLSIIDTFLTLLLPFSMIIFMTTRLLIDISRLYKKPAEDRIGSNSNSVSDSQGETNESNSANDRVVKQALKAQAKLKRMLVVVIIVFVVLNLPSHAIRVQFFFRSTTESHYSVSRTEVYWQHIVQILYYINFAVNFVLYSACAKSFRHALLRQPLASCADCSCIRNPFNKLLNKKIRKSKLSDISYPAGRHEGNINSRLVEIHLSEIQISQLPSLDSEYVCQSPPCLLRPEETIHE